MPSPPESCCFCLTLRSGTIGIATANCLLYLALFIGYLTSPTIDPGGLREGLAVTTLDISLFIICSIQVLVNILLVVGSVKNISSLTIPWLCANAVFMIIALIGIGIIILFGTTKLNLNYTEFVTALTTTGILTAINLFCCIVVFTLRTNLIELQRDRFHSVVPIACPAQPPCPSSHYQMGDTQTQLPEDAPPAYDTVVANTGK